MYSTLHNHKLQECFEKNILDFQKLIRCNQRIRNLVILPFSVWKTALEPVDVLLGGYISGGAFITLDKRLILPFLKIVFLDLVNRKRVINDDVFISAQ